MNVKQVLVIRRDLGMQRGKEIGQGSHAAMDFLLDRIKKVANGEFWPASYNNPPTIGEILQLTSEQMHWLLNEEHTKVVLQAKDLAELLEVEKLCRDAGLETWLVTDLGFTPAGSGKKGQKNHTALGIGPNNGEAIDRITGKTGLHPLKLY